MTATPDEPDFEQALQETEDALQALKSRFVQVQRDQRRQQELQYRLENTRRLAGEDPIPMLRAELRQIQKQLEDLEIALESRLFSWKGLHEVFWQAVRFGGLGIVIGWALRSCTGS